MIMGADRISKIYSYVQLYWLRQFHFQVTALNAGQLASNGNVSLEVIHINPLIHDPGYRAAVAFVIALIIDFLIFLSAYVIIKGIRKKKNNNIGLNFGI